MQYAYNYVGSKWISWRRFGESHNSKLVQEKIVDFVTDNIKGHLNLKRSHGILVVNSYIHKCLLH